MNTNMNDKHGATDVMSADEAIKRLREGNARYLEAKTAQGNVSPQIRRSTFEEGQHPFAIVLACSDSRVIPEAIFSAGIGDLFTIRVAGNVVDNHQLGSVEYAESHLNCKLVVVLGAYRLRRGRCRDAPRTLRYREVHHRRDQRRHRRRGRRGNGMPEERRAQRETYRGKPPAAQRRGQQRLARHRRAVPH